MAKTEESGAAAHISMLPFASDTQVANQLRRGKQAISVSIGTPNVNRGVSAAIDVGTNTRRYDLMLSRTIFSDYGWFASGKSLQSRETQQTGQFQWAEAPLD